MTAVRRAGKNVPPRDIELRKTPRGFSRYEKLRLKAERAKKETVITAQVRVDAVFEISATVASPQPCSWRGASSPATTGS
jgi:hypothetical protein